MTEASRRSFLIGAVALVTAPAIIRIENLMPVKSMLPSPTPIWSIGLDQRASYRWVAQRGGEIIDGVDKLISLDVFPVPGAVSGDAMRMVTIRRDADGRLIIPRDVHQTVMTPEGKIYTRFNGEKLQVDL